MNFEDLPCYENAQRLVRLETQLSNMDKKLDDLADHPCSRCQNISRLTRLSTEMRVIKWVGSISIAGFIANLIEGWLK